jgi:hypothetical protein
MTRKIAVEIAPKHGHVIITGDHLIIADVGGDVALFDVDDLVSLGAALAQASRKLHSSRTPPFQARVRCSEMRHARSAMRQEK